MPRILRTISALQDLDDIWDYIAIENHHPEAADHLLDRIDEVLSLILTQPAMGEKVDHLRPNTRRFVVEGHYLLFYDEIDDDIRLLRVLHGAKLIRPADLHG